MATQNKIIEMIGAIKTIYSYYAKDTNAGLLVGVWNKLLEGYEDDIVEVAFYKALKTCKMPPTPADVIEQINAMHVSIEPSDEELWTVYEKALNDTLRQTQMFNYTYVDESGLSQGEQARRRVDTIWEDLPDKIKRYVATKGELMRLAREYGASYEFCTFEKQRFMKSMPIMKKRQEYNSLLLSGSSYRLLSEGE